ncbi:hypothetical protein [Tenacibaculum aiptasiae]|uniref:hypothetical protein n=1 Tax=Tenacibaculum aiptasiae TaxID=426481 RepID=UPI0015881CBD|nr:hypothetical protein [Tenacibaculum aiptasiae]
MKNIKIKIIIILQIVALTLIIIELFSKWNYPLIPIIGYLILAFGFFWMYYHRKKEDCS